MPGQTVLIADDDPRLRDLLKWILESGEFRVVAAADGPSALVAAREVNPDLYLLDVDMPGMSGLEVCRQLRAEQVISPIVMLTGMSSEEAKVAGLEAGADDYQTKPFARRELLARVNAQLRRLSVYTADSGPSAFVTGNLRIDFDQHLATKRGRDLPLTPTEFRILAYLARLPGEVRTSAAILREVWGAEYGEEVHVLRVNIARLRQKIEDVVTRPRYVLTHVRVGYSLAVIEPGVN